MTIIITRQQEQFQYKIPFKSTTLLKALYHIKNYQDKSLTFSSNCRSGICGECGVRINGREVLACSIKIKDGDIVEPLKYHKVARDLKVDKRNTKNLLHISSTWLHSFKNIKPTAQDVELTKLQSDCILCNLCHSACPILEVNPNFISPFALTRAYRYIADVRENNKKNSIDAIQSNGIWDCTLCGECSSVCPQNIDPKMDILMLQGVSVNFGYANPNFMNMNFNS